MIKLILFLAALIQAFEFKGITADLDESIYSISHQSKLTEDSYWFQYDNAYLGPIGMFTIRFNNYKAEEDAYPRLYQLFVVERGLKLKYRVVQNGIYTIGMYVPYDQDESDSIAQEAVDQIDKFKFPDPTMIRKRITPKISPKGLLFEGRNIQGRIRHENF